MANEIFVKAGECVVVRSMLTSKLKIGSEVCLIDIGDECTTFRFLSGFSGIGSLFAGDFLLAASPSVDSLSYPFKYKVGIGLTPVGLPY